MHSGIHRVDAVEGRVRRNDAGLEQLGQAVDLEDAASDRVGQYVNDVKENLIKIGFEDVSTFTGRLKD